MSDDLARRQANLVRYRELMVEIEHNAAMAEASRTGQRAPVKPETPEQTLQRIKANAVPLPKLSPEALRRYGYQAEEDAA